MRAWFWTIFVFIAAVALALVLREHNGNVLIAVPPWRIELSLTLAVLLLLALFVIFHVVLRVFGWLGQRPERFRSWRSLRSQKRDYELLESGWINVLEGRYNDAEKELAKLMGRTRSNARKVLAALASARASHHQGHYERRDQALTTARQASGTDTRLLEATSTVAAEMYLDQNRPDDALALLQPLQDASSRHLHTTRLLLRAHRQLRNHDRVYELTRLLLRRSVIDRAEAEQLVETSTAARLHAAGMEGFKPIWNDLKAEERALPDIALAAAAIQSAAGHHDEASRILEAALAVRLDHRLLSAYSQCPPDIVARRLSKAEVWLKSHPDDPALLAALGHLCLTGQLWGQGEHYLLRSMSLRSDVRIHALLGNLYDRLGRPDDAMKYWRLASGVAGVLPPIEVARYLPAADTRSDPTLIDVEQMPQVQMADLQAPVAASAADFSHDAQTAGEEAFQAMAAGAPSGSVAAADQEVKSSPESSLDDYFDSAPIPGVDLSQTSDRPRRN